MRGRRDCGFRTWGREIRFAEIGLVVAWGYAVRSWNKGLGIQFG